MARIELLEAELQSRKDALKKLYGKVDQFPQKQKRLDAINENLGMRFNRRFRRDVFGASMISGHRCFRGIVTSCFRSDSIFGEFIQKRI